MPGDTNPYIAEPADFLRPADNGWPSFSALVRAKFERIIFIPYIRADTEIKYVDGADWLSVSVQVKIGDERIKAAMIGGDLPSLRIDSDLKTIFKNAPAGSEGAVLLVILRREGKGIFGPHRKLAIAAASTLLYASASPNRVDLSIRPLPLLSSSEAGSSASVPSDMQIREAAENVSQADRSNSLVRWRE